MWRVVFAWALVSAHVAHAQGFFSSSPGDLSTSHAALDAQARCNDCHVNGTRAVANKLCLDCHDHQDLAKRIAAGEGFHASPLVKGKKCEVCHDEHQERGFDLMGWSSIAGGEKGFRHDLTGWPLAGKHATTDCAECHTARNKQGLKVYMGTSTLCGDSGCHGPDQPHKLVRKPLLACERCHTQSVWKPARKPMRFDHDDRLDAGMPILGSHIGLACVKCHAGNVYNLPAAKPAACGNAGCHHSTHDGHLFGQRACDWCHSPTFEDFKQTTSRDIPFFDHEGRTRFALGAHAKLRCYDCHTKQLGERKPVAACANCHAKDNRHRDRFKAFGSPPACGACHPTTSFREHRFDHGRRTGYALTSKHAQIACRACHRGRGPADFENFRGVTTCKECHQHRKAHASPANPDGPWGSSKCLKCHTRGGDRTMRAPAALEREWHGPSSDFPLVKKHKGITCARCHKARTPATVVTTFDSESAECGERCHEDSLHQGTLGEKCTPCHASGTWDALEFDHDVETFPDGTDGFPLEGEHENNDCESCHGRERKFKDTPRACSAEGCHAKDDAHKGRLGDDCGKCHLETGDNLFNHNTMSAFHLDGKHLQVRCSDCHPSVTFKPRPMTCFGCHPEPAVHKGQYGTGCEQCHTTRTWEDIKPLHDVGDFSLKGMHDNVACERCHRDNRPLAGSGNLCINCHRQDDIHGNSLSPRCGECHTQWSFTPARFDHSRVGCNLTGLHRTLSCFDCHKNGNFSAITAECVGCHLDDAIRHGPTHVAALYRTTCTQGGACHNANSWTPQTVGSRESVCR